MLWVEHTTAQADRGCARSMMNLALIVALMTVFANRPGQWPIGTLAGRWMSPELRYLANDMAFATAYFAIAAGLELLVRRVGRDAAARPA